MQQETELVRNKKGTVLYSIVAAFFLFWSWVWYYGDQSLQDGTTLSSRLLRSVGVFKLYMGGTLCQMCAITSVLVLFSLLRWRIYFFGLMGGIMMIATTNLVSFFIIKATPIVLVLNCFITYLALPLVTTRRTITFSELRPLNERSKVDAGIPMERISSPPIVINVPPPIYSSQPQGNFYTPPFPNGKI